MKFSQLFTRTRKEAPKDEVAKNAQLLIRGGFVHKEMAGVYSYLPLGLRVLNKIENIIREEMNVIGGQEVEMTVLQNKELWDLTDRWSDETVDAWFKTQLKSGSEVGLGFTHEEPLAAVMREHVNSYKDLPKYVYQIQTKFRKEFRAKSGILRGHEFLMKDLYSFNKTMEEQDAFYEQAKQAYMNIFNRCGIGEETFITFASGGVFSKYSHEFQTLCNAGEDTIYLDRKKKLAVNKEVYNDEALKEAGVDEDEVKEEKAIEVGNIFKLGTKYSEALGLVFTDEAGESKPVIMGSYGIGLGRLMGTVVEVLSDDKGIVWPETIAPFKVHLIALEGVEAEADKLYDDLIDHGIEVIYDDRSDKAPGEKFADADLIGCPIRLVMSKKTVEDDSVEIKKRRSETVENIKLTKIVEVL
ncbi:MAG: aminoacyl--tRNA ligase-related protein [Parcubacteria group bacterium]